jgi:cytochrome b subunit of formate dehydrogenase
MELLRTATNPWGQKILVGIGWDLVWLAVIASAAFVVAHLVWMRLQRRRREAEAPASVPTAAGLPQRLLRHTMTARVFHWSMSVAMFGLLITAFVPVLGLKFPWVTLHWSAGLVLFLAIAWHIIHVLGWQDFWSMWISGRDVHEGMVELRHAVSAKAPAAPRAGKYPVDHKLYHHLAALVTVVAIATGLLMMVRIDTPLWPRNPYLLADSTWGWVYLAHGLSGVSLIGLVTAHVYFAFRPEKRWITWSMVRGWVTPERYLAHHDPQRWQPQGVGPTSPPAGGALADATAQAPREGA